MSKLSTLLLESSSLAQPTGETPDNHINPEDPTFQTSESVALTVIGAMQRVDQGQPPGNKNNDLLRQFLALIPREALISAYNETFGNA